jgi:hypothetical protein
MYHIPYLQQITVLFHRIQGQCIQGSLAGLFSPTRRVVRHRHNPSPANHDWAFPELYDRPQGGPERSNIICVVFASFHVFEARAYRYSVTSHMALAKLVLTC